MLDINEIQKITERTIEENKQKAELEQIKKEQEKQHWANDFEKDNIKELEKIEKIILKYAREGKTLIDKMCYDDGSYEHCLDLCNYLELNGFHAYYSSWELTIRWNKPTKQKPISFSYSRCSSDDDYDVKPREGLNFNEESAYYNSNETSKERSERSGHNCMWTK